MIRLRDITLSRGGKDLLRNSNATIQQGERLALIGINGSGKTTLLKALTGDVLPDSGSIELAKLSISVLAQDPPRSEHPGWQYVLDADTALIEANAALVQAHQSDDGMAIATALDAWQLAGGADAQARSFELLNGLGFTTAQAEQSVNSLSGGWRMRLNLARAMFRPCDVLLLDEPTNHLDLDAVLWLERKLSRLPASILIVSHDRDFLDSVVTGTLSIEDGQLRRYRGGYSACEAQRLQRMVDEQRINEQTRKEAAHLQSFINRFRAQATKARQVQSRVKAMQRLAVAAPLTASRRLNLAFEDVGKLPDPVLTCEDLNAGYGDTQILGGVNLKIERGARIGVLGRNGRGKTTLIRTLIGSLPPLGGMLQRTPKMRIAYFAQDAVDHLRDAESALEHLRRETLKYRKQAPPDGELRSWLGRFSFSNEDAIRPTGPMSGGERSRLVLAIVTWIRPQFLVLDEPTNHLDGDTRDALAQALQEFDGVLLLVSHDRHLLRVCVDSFILVDQGSVREFDGDLQDYANFLRQAERDDANQERSTNTNGSRQSKKEQRRDAANKRAQVASRAKPLKRELAKLEQAIAKHEQRISELDSQLGDQSQYEDKFAVASIARERGEIAEKLAKAESHWLDLSQEIDTLHQ